ncbi:hypothetical protein BH09MYX1_BH09MYX1_21270 [soil metagenome]
MRAVCLLASLAAAALSIAACNRDPIVVARVVTVHVPRDCSTNGRLYGVYYAWGDFQPTVDRPAQEKLFLDPGAGLPDLPGDARALVLDASDVSGGRWLGLTHVAAEGNVDLLLWPSDGECALTTATEAASDRVVGAMDDGRILVSAGKRADDTVPSSFVVDLARGVVAPVALGLLNPRLRSRIDAFGGGAIVSGGVSIDGATTLANAEIFDPRANVFDRTKIVPLSDARAEHGSVRLASGDVLLVGGRNGNGLLKSMERIDAALGQASKDNLQNLEQPRRRPIVLRLGSGEIMVAGGFDAAAVPIGQIEFFSADAKSTRPSTAVIPARPQMDCAATDGGGAVCVIARVGGDPSDFAGVWIVSADRGVSKAAVQINQSDPNSPPALTDVRLLPGAEGKLVLWTGSSFLRWDPWAEAFIADANLVGDGPKLGQPMVAADPGLLVWLGAKGEIVGRRFSVRNDYTADPFPYAVSTQAGLAPDRGPIGSLMKFSIDDGLDLRQDTSVFVADLRFRDFTLDVDLKEGDALRLVLRAPESDFECTLPGSAPASIHVERRGGAVSVRSATTQRDCVAPPASDRVAIGLRGGAQQPLTDRVKNIRISR